LFLAFNWKFHAIDQEKKKKLSRPWMVTTINNKKKRQIIKYQRVMKQKATYTYTFTSTGAIT